jgi:hypothetical protein
MRQSSKLTLIISTRSNNIFTCESVSISTATSRSSTVIPSGNMKGANSSLSKSLSSESPVGGLDCFCRPLGPGCGELFCMPLVPGCGELPLLVRIVGRLCLPLLVGIVGRLCMPLLVGIGGRLCMPDEDPRIHA